MLNIASPPKPELTVFYDGLCRVCSGEIDVYRRQVGADQIEFVDISERGFSAENEGLDPMLVKKYFHAKTRNGEIIKGVDAFVEIWRLLPKFRLLSKIAPKPGISQLLRLGYQVFVVLRPWLPRKKADCEGDLCIR